MKPTLVAVGACALTLALQASAALPSPSVSRAEQAREPRAARADFRREKPSRGARHVADWVVHSGDNAGAPFIVIDKRHARLYAFSPGGRLQGASAVLLGYAKGDDSVPGIGERPIPQIRPHERTTPAGRFVAERGENLKGEDIVWVDYDAAVSLHRVRPTNPKERRLQRLASPTSADNRISYGCINVPVKFYDRVIPKLFTGAAPVIYVLPETRSAREVFGSYDVPSRQRRGHAARSSAPAMLSAPAR